MATTIKRYRGFSTAAFSVNRKSFMVTNAELVKQDLLNHIYTIPGERPHQPNFGTRIPLLAFEPLDEKTLSIIREDIEMVCNYDPRVRLVDMSMNVLPDLNAVAVFIDLEYLELDVKETLRLEFNTKS